MKLKLTMLKSRFTLQDAVGVAVAVALTLVFCLGVVAPLAAKHKRLSAVQQAGVRERQRLAGLVTAAHNASTEIESMRGKLASMPVKVGPQSEMNQRLADLTALASDCDVAVLDVAPSAGQQIGRFFAVPIRITCQGNFRNCVAFTHAIHDRLHDLDVAWFKLEARREGPTATGAFTLELRWLTMPEGATVREAPRLSTASVGQ